jgi:DNA-binding response OmpR family regulator
MNLRILVVEPSESIADLIAVNFSREFGAEVLIFDKASKAVDALRRGASFDLFVVRNRASESADK